MIGFIPLFTVSTLIYPECDENASRPKVKKLIYFVLYYKLWVLSKPISMPESDPILSLCLAHGGVYPSIFRFISRW